MAKKGRKSNGQFTKGHSGKSKGSKKKVTRRASAGSPGIVVVRTGGGPVTKKAKKGRGGRGGGLSRFTSAFSGGGAMAVVKSGGYVAAGFIGSDWLTSKLSGFYENWAKKPLPAIGRIVVKAGVGVAAWQFLRKPLGPQMAGMVAAGAAGSAVLDLWDAWKAGSLFAGEDFEGDDFEGEDFEGEDFE